MATVGQAEHDVENGGTLVVAQGDPAQFVLGRRVVEERREHALDQFRLRDVPVR